MLFILFSVLFSIAFSVVLFSQPVLLFLFCYNLLCVLFREVLCVVFYPILFCCHFVYVLCLTFALCTWIYVLLTSSVEDLIFSIAVNKNKCLGACTTHQGSPHSSATDVNVFAWSPIRIGSTVIQKSENVSSLFWFRSETVLVSWRRRNIFAEIFTARALIKPIWTLSESRETQLMLNNKANFLDGTAFRTRSVPELADRDHAMHEVEFSTVGWPRTLRSAFFDYVCPANCVQSSSG